MHSTVVCFVSCSLFGYFSIIRFQRSPIFCALQFSNEWELSLANVGIVAHYRRILIKHVSRNLSHYNQLWYCWSCSPSFFFSFVIFFFVFFVHFIHILLPSHNRRVLSFSLYRQCLVPLSTQTTVPSNLWSNCYFSFINFYNILHKPAQSCHNHWY